MGKRSKPKEPSDFTLLCREHFKGLKFPSRIQREAGQKLKKLGPEATIEFLKGKDDAKDIRPPAKALVIAQSRPFAEWPLVQYSRQMQEIVYGKIQGRAGKKEIVSLGLSESAFATAVNAWHVGGKPKPSEETRARWHDSLGMSTPSLHAQAQNLVIKAVISVRQGVLTKVENRNEKNRQKTQKRVDAGERIVFVEEKAYSDAGYLIDPPGVNDTIHVYQAASPEPCPIDFTGLPVGCKAQDPKTVLEHLPYNRLDIMKGEPGYIPEWQRASLNRHKNHRRRAWYANSLNKPKSSYTVSKRSGTANRSSSTAKVAQIQKARIEGALPVLINLREDWVLVDARGLLRNACYRRLVPDQGLSLEGLLELFSTDAVIDVRRGVVTILYKNGVATARKNSVKGKKSRDLLLGLTKDKPVVLVSIDLGQTNPLAAKFSRVSQSNGELEAQLITRDPLDDTTIAEISRYRVANDQLLEQINVTALEGLSQGHRAEILRAKNDSPEACKQRIAQVLRVDPLKIPWKEMTLYTEFLAEAHKANGGDPQLVEFKPKNQKLMNRRDSKIKNLEGIRVSVSPEAAQAYREAKWDVQRTSLEYRRLSTWKRELTKKVVNRLRVKAVKVSQCDVVVFAIEDLNVKIMHGSGKRDKGWVALFTAKRENRWFMQAFHKAISELGPHKGTPVIEVVPHRTSITCTKCGHCDPKNREGEKFLCLECGFAANTDLEIATDNIERVALTGKPMPKSNREQSGGAKKPGGARKSNKPEQFPEKDLAAE